MRGGVARSHEALLVIFWSLSCVRRLHLCKSSLTQSTEEYLFGRCVQGKSKVKGVRPPFFWAVPKLPNLPDCFDFLQEVAEKMHYPSFIVPARVAQVGTPVRRWLPHPMGHTMTLRILRRVLVAAGVDEGDAAQYSFNSCRRFLPTLSAVLGFTREESQAIGNWVDDPARGAEAAAPPTMSVHYSDQKALASGMAKRKALLKFFDLASKIDSAQDILAGGGTLLSVDSITWSDLGKAQEVKKRKREEKKAKKQTAETKQAKKDKKGKAKRQGRHGRH